MFDATLLDALIADSEITSYLSTYTDSSGSSPAIFSNSAPEKAEFTYLVFRIIDSGNDEDSVIDTFDVVFDLFGYSKSGANERAAIKKIIELLDRNHLTGDDYYDTIRLFKREIFLVETDDIKTQHYNIRFEARAGRSGWMQSL